MCLLWVGCLIISVNQVRSEELFPVGPQLQNRVDFWIKIYTQYSKEEVVLHDTDHLEVIYDVVNVHESFFESLTRSGRKRHLETAKQEFKKILAKLAGLKEPVDTVALTEKELFVYNLWAHVSDENKFKTAIDNIHAQPGLRALYQSGLQRSGRYLTEMKTIFRGYGLPEDLCYLPHVESAFNYRAYSKVGAAGVWQFTGSTGRLYMRINYGIDERYDPLIATDAAARLLRHNYEELGSWPLALTAYNHGSNGMQRAKTLLQTDDMEKIIQQYDGRTFGFASKNFYAEFIAAVEVAKNYKRYFGEIAFEQPDTFKVMQTPDNMTLDALTKQLQITKDEIAQLNPGLRPPILRSLRRIPKGYTLRLPVHVTVDAQALYAQKPATGKPDLPMTETSYFVEEGDNLGAIARSAGTSIEVIMDLNNMIDPRRLRVGQKLLLPSAFKENKPAALKSLQVVQTIPAPDSTKTKLVVGFADSTLQLLARARHHALSSVNYGPPLSDDADFVVNFTEPQDNVIIVQSEETISHIADWLGLTPQKLRELNSMRPQANVQAGRKFIVDFSRVNQADFHRKRLQYHRSLQEGFFANYKVQGTRNYTVKNGDSVWELCNRRFDLPFWLLARYNKGLNLLQLHPGVEILVPIVTPTMENANAHPEA
jgi:membrane-bound lytic murein transglycosylase D